MIGPDAIPMAARLNSLAQQALKLPLPPVKLGRHDRAFEVADGASNSARGLDQHHSPTHATRSYVLVTFLLLRNDGLSKLLPGSAEVKGISSNG